MPLIGIGTDLVDFRRIERMLRDFPSRFAARVLAPSEREELARKTDFSARVAFCARRMAAKEACAKALGTGFSGGVHLRDIAVASRAGGAPEIILSGGALARLVALAGPNAPAKIHISLSDEPPYAQAFVVIEAI